MSVFTYRENPGQGGVIAVLFKTGLVSSLNAINRLVSVGYPADSSLPFHSHHVRASVHRCPISNLFTSLLGSSHATNYTVILRRDDSNPLCSFPGQPLNSCSVNWDWSKLCRVKYFIHVFRMTNITLPPRPKQKPQNAACNWFCIHFLECDKKQ